MIKCYSRLQSNYTIYTFDPKSQQLDLRPTPTYLSPIYKIIKAQLQIDYNYKNNINTVAPCSFEFCSVLGMFS